ncbi:hypothetical protein O181_027384 [Austropuccinia psidii MF-1]|uniref:Uncharacterized protein n=1 Tax=Austropuccinia psidii MF-1 TaxID=1389203 RepID=A0A9Q3CNZ2_9BASI|nr:hypothetical protein [Austropuccinia psidii MF-1]
MVASRHQFPQVTTLPGVLKRIDAWQVVIQPDLTGHVGRKAVRGTPRQFSVASWLINVPQLSQMNLVRKLVSNKQKCYLRGCLPQRMGGSLTHAPMINGHRSSVQTNNYARCLGRIACVSVPEHPEAGTLTNKQYTNADGFVIDQLNDYDSYGAALQVNFRVLAWSLSTIDDA